jgi:hypothetical protein
MLTMNYEDYVPPFRVREARRDTEDEKSIRSV